jgi:hypothetical protein
MKGANLLFLPMQDLPNGVRAGLVPGKTYEYLAARRPILAAVPDGDARDLLKESAAAILCRPGDVEAIATGIAHQLAQWRSGIAPREPEPAVLARYEHRALAAQVARVMEIVLANGREESDRRIVPLPPARRTAGAP